MKTNGKNRGDVMVIGGGVSGIQAALDLSESNFKVYLVDSAPAIGGHMAQFDKVSTMAIVDVEMAGGSFLSTGIFAGRLKLPMEIQEQTIMSIFYNAIQNFHYFFSFI